MLETTIFTIIWGFFIGVLVSAPMGPTGILVIQRTLNKGQLPGLLTGFGASLSDFIYALISVFALGLVVDWLEQYRSTLQFAGSFFIALSAIYLWKSNPAAGLGAKDTSTAMMSPRMRASGVLKNFFSGFGITISNPLIIFFYIALLIISFRRKHTLEFVFPEELIYLHILNDNVYARKLIVYKFFKSESLSK